MKLIELPKNTIFKIVDLNNLCKNMKDRFCSMDIQKGSIGRVLNRGFFGPIEIEIDDSKLAIGRKMAAKIEVKTLECPIF